MAWGDWGSTRAVSTLRMDTGSRASTWGVSWFPKIEEVPGFVRLQFLSVWTSHVALRCAWEQGCLRSWGLEWGCMDDLALAYSCSFAVDFQPRGLRSFPLVPWFPSLGRCPLPPGDIWQCPETCGLSPWQRNNYWHLVGGGQGCC